jgi:hypothetical protein
MISAKTLGSIGFISPSGKLSKNFNVSVLRWIKKKSLGRETGVWNNLLLGILVQFDTIGKSVRSDETELWWLSMFLHLTVSSVSETLRQIVCNLSLYTVVQFISNELFSWGFKNVFFCLDKSTWIKWIHNSLPNLILHLQACYYSGISRLIYEDLEYKVCSLFSWFKHISCKVWCLGRFRLVSRVT